MNVIELSIFASRMDAICEEMGAVLRRSALSPNIKDRLDFSCAIFDIQGELCAQAAHIPVHLGSMAYAMRDIVNKVEWMPGDMMIVNDPFLGGTHLPDVTMIAPVYAQHSLVGFVANRAHHADIGATTPGSMPISSSLDEEGMIIPPTLIMSAGRLDESLMASLAGATRNMKQSHGDFTAQISANITGIRRLLEIINVSTVDEYLNGLVALNDYAYRLAWSGLQEIPKGRYCFEDVLDDDGMGHDDIPIRVCIDVRQDHIHVDFNGTAPQVRGNINCPLSVAAAGVYYVFRCLMPSNTPACAGSFRAIKLAAEQGCLLNANRPAAVAAGNVETSTRVVDVVMGALAQAVPEKIPAASHGSMNNVAMGVQAEAGSWDYYETLGGGMGAGSQSHGLSAKQTHMTNTLNTPIESLEMHFPLRIRRYAIRDHSGGRGQYCGGDGLEREYEFLSETTVTLLTERRRHRPWGLQQGEDGCTGENSYDGSILPPKTSFMARPGKRLLIKTPGGGGWGPC